MPKLTVKKIIKAFVPYGLLYLIKQKETNYSSPISYRPFSRIFDKNYIFLYAGDIPETKGYSHFNMLGLSLNRSDKRHICHNIKYRHDLPDESVDLYQAEDVFEHINYDSLKFVVKEIFRLLKPNGFFRLSVPDYNNPEHLQDKYLLKRECGSVLFDPRGGGNYDLESQKVINGGHIWFPKYGLVKDLLEMVEWSSINFLQYWDDTGKRHYKEIDYSKCYVHRPESMIIDCYK